MTFLGELKAHKKNLTSVGDFSFKIIIEVRKTNIRGFFTQLSINCDKNRSKSS